VPFPFDLPFVQQASLEILLLSVAAGLLGTWIVLRGLAFYSHAVGTGAFPGLVIADGLGLSPPLCALAAALLIALGLERLGRGRRSGYDSLTALVLTGALAAGILLASDVYHSGANVETLLFGSLLLVGDRDLALAGLASVLALAGTVLLGRRWLATGFDPAGARGLGLRSPLPDLALLALVAVAIVAALNAVGALLAGALFVVPAATARLWSRRLLPWQVWSVALVAVEGIAGLWLSVETDAPPGSTIAVLGAGVFAVAAVARALLPRLRPRALAVAGAAVVLALAATGCARSSASGPGLDVVATTTQIGDWARIVGGPQVDVHQLLQPNTDPHEYEPRPSDVTATAAARVVLENGDGLDRWMAKVISQAGGSPRVVVLGDHVPVRLPGESSGAEASRTDPHWWHDPRDADAAVRQIGRALSSADPGHARLYRRRAARYETMLATLDRDIARCIDQLAPSQRLLVTDHDAFGYFAGRYGLQVVGAVIPSQTTEAEPSAGDTAALIDLIRREHVHAVFPESSINPDLAEAVARETGASSNETLYGDTLGPKGSAGATYLGMERANAQAMVRGLSGGTRSCAVGGGS
jgi:ABC-type Zn uptake system ZnuABC Zn-binding protein ZnuA/ABC-type Mn2+/Zn2+ transport system permease subunit